jgi:hypothetical protein
MKEMKYKIPFGASYKLPNLLMKEVWKRLPAVQRRTLIMFLHVPLDSYTLVGISGVSESLDIPKTATMGAVRDWDFYIAVQERIRELARKAGVPPIVYDYLAWDASH